jgi:hypothetical protein
LLLSKACKLNKDSFCVIAGFSLLVPRFCSTQSYNSQKIAMSPDNLNPSAQTGLNLGLFTIPQSILLQMGTTSVLMLVLAQKTATQTLYAIGQASEELFRGDRLPILDFPEDSHSNS